MNDSSTVQNSDKTAKNQIITTASGGNNKFFKIALILLAIVMLIIISEVGYLIFAKRGTSLFKFGQTTVQEEQGRPLANITPPPPFLPKEEVKSITVDSEKARKFVDMLDTMVASGRPEGLDIATIYYEISGVIINSGFDKKEVDDITYMYRLFFRQQDGNTLTYRLGEEELINAQVSLVSSSGESKISISDIRPDDLVVIKVTTNLLDAGSPLKVVLEVTR